ncbi:polyphosphate kinase 2 [Desulfosediminicola flagellatus]|uniref:polyphosphate kinase 2 n=1 Tax=Desulfosediminicola flagellatus TaxID=2569541 RepID=UPI001E600A96|nr:polyphosphate kinase 2 [Desulfosediminicola flagellatus]
MKTATRGNSVPKTLVEKSSDTILEIDTLELMEAEPIKIKLSHLALNKKSRQLSKKDKYKIIDSALKSYCDKQELMSYQAELIKMQQHLEKTGKKMIILFDGRDASGKGGTIRRVCRYMNEKHYRIVALGKPSKTQQTELHMKRYIEQFPRTGEIVLFDRSWYNRAMVEPVMGFCTPKQYKRFMNKVVNYERNFTDDGKTILLKLYFSVSKKEQARRFERRRSDPLRQWKLSEVDLQAQDLWDEFSNAKYQLLQKAHTPDSKWYVVKSDNKQLARLQTIKLILNKVKYHGRSRSLDFKTDNTIIIPGNIELKNMKKERKMFGKFLT